MRLSTLHTSILVAVSVSVTAASVPAAEARQTLRLAENWRFTRGNPEGAAGVDFDDSQWQTVRVPHDFAITGPFDPMADPGTGKLPWRDEAWYRTTIRLDRADAGKQVYLDFDGAMAFPEVYVNGQLAGEWKYGYTSFRVDASKFVRFGDENVVALHVDTRRHGSRWYPGAGLYRKVTRTLCDPVHVAHWGTFVTTPAVTNAKAEIAVATTVENHSDRAQVVTVETAIVDPNGKEVARLSSSQAVAAGDSAPLNQSGMLTDFQRWDVDSPKLYTAKTSVIRSGTTCDTTLTTFGIRTFKFTADDGFHLNGRRVQLKGVNLHHDHGPLGAAFYPRAMQRQLEILAEMGCNAIRTSHNPPAPELLDLCDRMGMIVFDECFDKWDRTADRVGGESLAEYGEQQLRNLILRDRNHPSVVIWSVGNEISDVEVNRNGDAAEQVRTMADLARKYDPTRPITQACHIPAALNHGMHRGLDVQSWNYGEKYAEAKKKYPEMPTIYSESASALSTRGFYALPHPEHKTDYSEQLQVDSYDLNAAAWSDIPDLEFDRMQRDRFCGGEFVWTGFDYLGEPTPFGSRKVGDRTIRQEQTARSSYFGIVDLCGIPKDRYYLYRSHWAPEKTTVHILPHWNWPDRVGKNVPVYVYTNGDSAELFLNGRSLGRRVKKTRSEEPVNLAKGQSATASTEETDKGNLIAHAADGDPDTRWCAADGDTPQWWQVDLGQPQPIRACRVTFERSSGSYQYNLLASTDGEEWTALAAKDDFADHGRTVVHACDLEARYVRIEFNRLQGCWASIHELELFSEEVGGSYYDVTDYYRLRWQEVAYEPGELKAVVYRDGERIAEARMRTAGEPAAIRLTADRTSLDSSGDDLAYVLVEALDSDGNICPLADNLIRFQVGGPAEIAGVGNGNPQSLEPFVADCRKLFFGKAMLILRATQGEGGAIALSAQSDGLTGSRVAVASAAK